jgi:hypothetical protein
MNVTNEQFQAVIRVLVDARGEANALTLDEITARAGLPNRRTTETLIETRLGDFPYPLVAGGAGYFIPVQAEQINKYIRSLGSRMVSLAIRKRAVVRKALAQGWKREGKWFARPPQQLDLFERAAAPRICVTSETTERTV